MSCGFVWTSEGITPETHTKKMKKEMISATSAKQARKLAPWAAKVVKVEGGYMAFESVSDYQTWRKQT